MAKPDPRLLDPARYPARVEIMTRFQDLDSNHHINNVATAAMFEDVRVRFDWGIGLRDIFHAEGKNAMVVSIGLEYLAEAFYPAPIIAYAGGLSIGGTSWSVGAILTQGGTVSAFSRATIVGVKDGRPTPLPEQFRAALRENMIRLEDPDE
ncbi:MAG: thioesterase family protein [Sphingobium sp.]